MCGITGICNLRPGEPIKDLAIRQMLALIRYRGPDGFGIYHDDQVGLGSARLSIIDIAGGDQPICNEDHTIWIVFNGEVFNYLELRIELEKMGHRFATNSDTEVIVHLYEDFGEDCLRYLNGQFAIAIWDIRNQRLFLARDRVGIRPIFYTTYKDRLIFGSEIKTIISQGVTAEIDPLSLDQIFTYWSVLPGRTIFKDIFELPPGHYMVVEGGQITVKAYWNLDFTEDVLSDRNLADYLEEFEQLLVDAARIRLRADVPVGAYLSGGLDSSVISAIIRNYTQTHLDTFSISFSDPEFDESPFQRKMAEFLGTQHQVVFARHEDIGRVFPNVIWHTETPILRTAPVPMYLLSELVRSNQYKVVLTGEGADEFLAGYDIFKEAIIRRFWARQPQSSIRPLLLLKLYPDISALPNQSAYLASFFGEGLTQTDRLDYSHAIRWRNTGRTKRFFLDEVQQEVASRHGEVESEVGYPDNFKQWSPLAQAQYIESSIFLSQYLLSSQGDRVAMAHSVEGRYPFLDYRVIEFCNRLPAKFKLNSLTEKYLLRQLAKKWLPEDIWQRPKRPYRAPIHRSFFGEKSQPYVRELLSPRWVEESGLFKPAAVFQMVQKLEAGKRLGETDDMALAGILSSQLVYQQFVTEFSNPSPVKPQEVLKSYSSHQFEQG